MDINIQIDINILHLHVYKKKTIKMYHGFVIN